MNAWNAGPPRAKHFYGVSYGPNPFHVLNLHMVPGSRHLIVYKGGGWAQEPLPTTAPGDGTFERGMLNQGFSVATLSVRPSDNDNGPNWYYPEPRKDVVRAVDFLRANSKRFEVPFETITMAGRSGGGIRAMEAEFLDPDRQLFDAIVETASCSDLTQLHPQGKAAAPYFGVNQHDMVPIHKLANVSAIQLIDQYGLEKAPPIYLNSNNDDTTNKSDPHSAYYQLILKDALAAQGHPHRFRWTPGGDLDFADVAQWLHLVLDFQATESF